MPNHSQFLVSYVFSLYLIDFSRKESSNFSWNACGLVTRGGEGRGEFPKLSGFHTKSQELKTHNEKNFKRSLQKGESHKVEVLTRIYFSINR
jgi:hypothetical protein